MENHIPKQNTIYNYLGTANCFRRNVQATENQALDNVFVMSSKNDYLYIEQTVVQFVVD